MDTNELQAECARLREENQMLLQQLQDAVTKISLGELVGTTTHEFNNVLMTVINYAQLGLRHTDDATREQAFRTILDAGNRAAQITQNVLGMARNRSSEKEPTELATLVDSSLLLLEREMRKYSVSVERVFESNLPEVLVQGNQIQQVLLNLLINARQAMPNGGRLVLTLALDAPSNMVKMVVRDYGSGISKKDLPRIFDRFFSTKKGPDESGKGGSGLGLSMCRDIILQHDGKIYVRSTVGKGTEFSILLPLAKPQEAPRPVRRTRKAPKKPE